MMPMHLPVYRATCFANAADVCMTMVGGRVPMEDRRVLSVDGNEILEPGTTAAQTMIARSGLLHRVDEPKTPRRPRFARYDDRAAAPIRRGFFSWFRHRRTC